MILVLSSIALLATGGAQFIHHHQHLDEATHHESEGHDESSCVLHMQLRAPLILDAAVPQLILVGLFVAFLTLLPQQRSAQVVHTRILCRGPPVLACMSAA